MRASPTSPRKTSADRPAEDDWADPLAGAVARVQAEVEIEAAREAATEEMALDELDEHLKGPPYLPRKDEDFTKERIFRYWYEPRKERPNLTGMWQQ